MNLSMPEHALAQLCASVGADLEEQRVGRAAELAAMGSNVRRGQQQAQHRRPVMAAHADRDAWKARMRDECLARVKAQRKGLLRQLRQVPPSLQQ